MNSLSMNNNAENFLQKAKLTLSTTKKVLKVAYFKLIL